MGYRDLLRMLVRHPDECMDSTYKPVQCLHYGLDLLGLSNDTDQPLLSLQEYVNRHQAKSDLFFSTPAIFDFALNGHDLTFSSSISTECAENNVVRCRLFEGRNRKRAIIILHHWNGSPSQYYPLARAANRLGMTAVCITLPYHDLRNVLSNKIASPMVSSNLGLTIRSLRQAVVDTKGVISWLHERGYERIGLVGSSIGSCVASLTAAHDSRVKAVVQILAASHFGEAVWTGRATRHIRAALEPTLTLEQVNSVWSIISPISYVGNLRENDVSILILSGKRDTVFLPYLTQRLIGSFREYEVKCKWHALPCGHYTVARLPWKTVAVAHAVPFLLAKL